MKNSTAKRFVCLLLAAIVVSVVLIVSAFQLLTLAEEDAYVKAIVTNGVASMPQNTGSTVGTVDVPENATNIEALFENGREISNIILRGNSLDTASVNAIKDAAPITVYHYRPTAGGGVGAQLGNATNVTLKNALKAQSGVIVDLRTENETSKNVVTLIGAITVPLDPKDNDVDDLQMTAVFSKPGMDARAITVGFDKVYTTIIDYASVSETTVLGGEL